MSDRYSNSPTLRLRIAESATRRGLLLGLTLLTVASLMLLWLGGYRVLAGVLIAPALGILVLCWRQPLRGAELRWRRGQWYLWHCGKERAIELSPASTHLPGLMYLRWRRAGGGQWQRLWLFSDSAPAATLRYLRLRLTLQG